MCYKYFNAHSFPKTFNLRNNLCNVYKIRNNKIYFKNRNYFNVNSF